jgi:hypothetical protein
VALADTYNGAHGEDAAWVAASAAKKERGLKLATQYLDSKYRMRWRGARFNEVQSLGWPRTGFYDYDGYEIEGETVPTGLKDACVELAIRVVNGDGLFPVNENPGLKAHSWGNQNESESKTYAGGSVAGGAKTYPIIEALLANLIHSGPLVERG